MILVARRAVLSRGVGLVTALTDFLFHRAEVGHEFFRISLFVALLVSRGLFKAMARQTALRSDGRKVRLMTKFCEAATFVCK